MSWRKPCFATWTKPSSTAHIVSQVKISGRSRSKTLASCRYFMACCSFLSLLEANFTWR